MELLDANAGEVHHVPFLPPLQSHPVQMTPSGHSALCFFQEGWNQAPLLLPGNQVHGRTARLQNDHHHEAGAGGGSAAQAHHENSSTSGQNERKALNLEIEPSPSQFVLSMSIPSDQTCLTDYQMLLRLSLEYFSATQQDVEARVRGRKQKIRLGQIGVRCRYCAHLPVPIRGRGACYYPKTLVNVYQAAQNIAGAHFRTDMFCCPFVPTCVSLEIDIQKPRRDASKAGRCYWVDACKHMGLYEKDGALWLQGYNSRQAGEENNSTVSSCTTATPF